jgi:hypothetical protein
MNLATLLMSLAGPLARRVFVSLGFSVVTYAGMSAVLDQLVGMAVSNLQGLSPDVVSLLQLAGVFQGLSILTGAYVAVLALVPLQRIIPNVGAST